jgi:tetratricopeptide (TPR) repeat protein
MKSQVVSIRAGIFLRCLSAAAVGLALAGCASTPAQPNLADTRPSSAQSVDQERRNRGFQHAEALYLSGRYPEAAAAFEQLSRSYPDDARVWLKYGNTLTKQGSYDSAATAFQRALSLDADQGGAALNLALVRLAQAQEALDAAVGRLAAGSPEHAQAQRLQGQLNSLLGAPGRGASNR